MPRIETERMLLRPFAATDAADVQRLADDPKVSGPTALLPAPYTLADAEAWIAGHGASDARGRGRPWAMLRRTDSTLLGAVSLEIAAKDQLGTLGYWVGRPYWGHGFATEAARAAVAFGFSLGLGKVAATVLANNAGSIAVLTRCRMRREGVLKGHALRNGQRLDVWCYGRLRA